MQHQVSKEHAKRTTEFIVDDVESGQILAALCDGRVLPMTRLAMEAGLSVARTRGCVDALVDAGILRMVPAVHGRHPAYQLADPERIRREGLASDRAVTSLQAGTPEAAMRSARLCYDHMAGKLGIALVDGLLARQYLLSHDRVFTLTSDGEDALEHLGVDLARLRSGNRPMIRACTDWSEQRPHIAGALGSAIRENFEQRGWIMRHPGSRVLTLTSEGHNGLRQWIGADLDA